MSKEPFNESPSHSALSVDRSTPVGVSNDGTDRGRLHIKVANLDNEPIPVTLVGGETNSIYDEITSVPPSSQMTIQTYNVPSDNKLNQIEVSGTNIAQYMIYLDAVLIAKKRTYFGGNLNEKFDFVSYPMSSGQILKVDVIHNRPDSGDFNSRIVVSVA